MGLVATLKFPSPGRGVTCSEKGPEVVNSLQLPRHRLLGLKQSGLWPPVSLGPYLLQGSHG